MKNDIHPKFNKKAKATCACGAKFEVGSILDEIKVEICSECHPFYTGIEKVVDTAGRVEKFKQRKKTASQMPKKTKKTKTKVTKKQKEEKKIKIGK